MLALEVPLGQRLSWQMDIPRPRFLVELGWTTVTRKNTMVLLVSD